MKFCIQNGKNTLKFRLRLLRNADQMPNACAVLCRASNSSQLLAEGEGRGKGVRERVSNVGVEVGARRSREGAAC